MTPTDKRHTDIISAALARTLSGLFQCRVARTPDDLAYRQYNRARSEWEGFSWRQASRLAARWQRALEREELATGDRVAIQLGNSLEWVCFDQAALALGLVVVPLYTMDTPANVAYILEDAAVRLLLVDTAAQWETLRPYCADAPSLRRVVCVNTGLDLPPGNDTILSPLDEWLDVPRTVATREDEAPLANLATDPHALATIIYTSGTTGRPKGVMLSHHNILWNAETVLAAVPCYREDLFFSFLPLSHTFERTAGYYLPMMAGSCIAYARSIQELAEDLVTIRPTLLVSVPRIFERVHAAVLHGLAKKGGLARRLFDWTVSIGWQRFEAGHGRGRIGILQRLAWPLLRRLVADRVLARLGGRLRIAVSGGAPLSVTVARTFIGLGLQLLQGYGLTEASPVVSANLPERNIPDSVGPPLPGIEVRIGADDELLVRCPSVMLGYWQSPEETRRVIDADGWLHTGDQATIEDGHIFIRGRIKDILVTSTGEKVSPADMEMAITQDRCFEMAMIVGEGKPFLAALLVVNRAAWEALAGRLGLDPRDPAALNSAEAVQQMLEKLEVLLHRFPGHSRVRKVYLTLEPWTIDNGLLTPTLKMKRREMEGRFAGQIRQLYAEHDLPA